MLFTKYKDLLHYALEVDGIISLKVSYWLAASTSAKSIWINVTTPNEIIIDSALSVPKNEYLDAMDALQNAFPTYTIINERDEIYHR